MNIKKLLHGGPLSGWKSVLGAIFYFLPQLPVAELDAFTKALAPVFIAWGALSRGIKNVSERK